jgi:hypothetical protein
MKKTVFVFVLLLLLLSVIVFVILSSSRSHDATNNGVSPVQLIDRPPLSTSTRPAVIDNRKTYRIATAQGDTMEVKDFLHASDTVIDTLNKGHYFLGNHFPDLSDEATSAPPYIIEYIEPVQTFNIALLQEPIGQARSQAEQHLAKALGVTPMQLCELKYMVSVPAKVYDMYAGSNLGFSFCPGATPL